MYDCYSIFSIQLMNYSNYEEAAILPLLFSLTGRMVSVNALNFLMANYLDKRILPT